MTSRKSESNSVEESSISFRANDIYLCDITDIKNYLLNLKTPLKAHFTFIHLDINNRVISEHHIVNLTDFRDLCLLLIQFFSLQNTAKILVIRTDKGEANFGKNKDYKYCRNLMSLTKLLGVKLLDYIVMQGGEFDSFKEDHGTIA